MAFVVDASVTMAWCFSDEADAFTSAVLERCRTESALVPGLWLLEVANVLLVAERRGRIDPAGSARFLALLGGLPIDVALDPPLDGIEALCDAARRHQLTAYHAAYLRLAVRHDLPLATKDERLAQAAGAEGARLLRPVE